VDLKQMFCLRRRCIEMGDSVKTRLRSDTNPSALYPRNFKAVARAAMTAVATTALLAGFAGSAGALPPEQPGDARTRMAMHSDSERPALNLPRSVPARTAAFSRSKDVNKPATAATDAAARAKGPLRILISLDKQQLTLYAGDEVIARSRVSSGQKGRSTPTGVFSIIQKDRWHRSNLYDDAPMYYMQRITWSGVALHQGIVPNYPASHGCIRLPEAFARQLWATTKVGARVIVTHGEVAPTAIAHAKLFAPKAVPAAESYNVKNAVMAAEQAWQLAMLDDTKTMAWTDVSVPPMPAADDAAKANARVLKRGAVSVFISRKEGKLFVRKGFEPVFDMPVTIEQPTVPLGTHVFTALEVDEHNVRWSVVSPAPKTSAAAALDRITIPQDAIDRISELMSAGASLVISDQGLGTETGAGTDFVVLNP
jgi:lipoprotein-anchoring transpeptidase ErfK/SrfK